MADSAQYFFDEVLKVIRLGRDVRSTMSAISFLAGRYDKATEKEPQMDPRLAEDVKRSIQDNYSFDRWVPIDKAWFAEGAEPVWVAYAFVQEPASIPVPHATMFFRRRTGPWKSIGLKWKPPGSFMEAAPRSIAKDCTGVVIQSPEPSTQLLAKRGGRHGRLGDYITVVWCGRVDATTAAKLRELLANMKLVKNDRASYLRTQTEPKEDPNFPVKAFRQKGYMIAANNCATLVEEIMDISCLKKWYTGVYTTDPTSCEFNEETHPVDTSFLTPSLEEIASLDGGRFGYNLIPGRTFTDRPSSLDLL